MNLTEQILQGKEFGNDRGVIFDLPKPQTSGTYTQQKTYASLKARELKEKYKKYPTMPEGWIFVAPTGDMVGGCLGVMMKVTGMQSKACTIYPDRVETTYFTQEDWLLIEPLVRKIQSL